MSVAPCNLELWRGREAKGKFDIRNVHCTPVDRASSRPNCGRDKRTHSQRSQFPVAFAQSAQTFMPGRRVSLCLREEVHNYSFEVPLCSHTKLGCKLQPSGTSATHGHGQHLMSVLSHVAPKLLRCRACGTRRNHGHPHSKMEPDCHRNIAPVLATGGLRPHRRVSQ